MVNPKGSWLEQQPVIDMKYVNALEKENAYLREREKHLTQACAKINSEVMQILGKALGYPWYKNDQENFPGATEEDGICSGAHVAETMAMEAARKITELEERVQKLSQAYFNASW